MFYEEDMETFELYLLLDPLVPQSRVTVNPNTTTICIEDNDGNCAVMHRHGRKTVLPNFVLQNLSNTPVICISKNSLVLLIPLTRTVHTTGINIMGVVGRNF